MEDLHSRKLTAGGPQNDALEKVNPLKTWQFLVSMLDFWGICVPGSKLSFSQHGCQGHVSHRDYWSEVSLLNHKIGDGHQSNSRGLYCIPTISWVVPPPSNSGNEGL